MISSRLHERNDYRFANISKTFYTINKNSPLKDCFHKYHTERVRYMYFANTLYHFNARLAMERYFCTQNQKGYDVMAKRKKHQRLPNGYGSIKFLGKNRQNPYAVHPPTKEFSLNGSPVIPKALCYVDDWLKGFIVLTAYKTGSYTPGMERDIEIAPNDKSLDSLAKQLLSDYNQTMHGKRNQEAEPTFKQVYDAFYEYKFERKYGKKYSGSSKNSTRAAFNNCTSLHNLIFKDLRHKDMQNILDTCPLKHASIELIKSLFKNMYRYAIVHEIVKENYSTALEITRPNDEEHGKPFNDKDLKVLWENKNDEIVEFILIMCYSGFRISAYKTLEVNLEKGYLKGGVKTIAGKNRTVPIHSGIFALVKKRHERLGCLLDKDITYFRNKMYDTLARLEIEHHKPHDCRHTFSMLCERYEVKESDRKRLLGHTFQNDITNAVYGHRLLCELSEEIEKIKICY